MKSGVSYALSLQQATAFREAKGRRDHEQENAELAGRSGVAARHTRMPRRLLELEMVLVMTSLNQFEARDRTLFAVAREFE